MSSPSGIPIGNTSGKSIWLVIPQRSGPLESLMSKFQELARKKVPTGDLNCPPHVRDAKQIFYKIAQATNGLTGGSDGEVDFGETGTEGDDEA